MIQRFNLVPTHRILVLLIAFAFSSPAAQSTNSGPFGFARGMAKRDVVALLGPQAIKEDKNDTLQVNTAPRPHRAFEFYQLIFSPRDGLLKIIAVGKDINTNTFGNEVQAQFSQMCSDISTVYGKAETLDNLTPGSVWTEPQYWMMGLLKQDRNLLALWSHRVLPNGLAGVGLTTHALSQEKAYLKLFYEFNGWNEYVDSKNADEAKVF